MKKKPKAEIPDDPRELLTKVQNVRWKKDLTYHRLTDEIRARLNPDDRFGARKISVPQVQRWLATHLEKWPRPRPSVVAAFKQWLAENQ